MKITLIAPAKLNLALDVLKKTPDGYHEIQTVLYEYPKLHDTVTLSRGKKRDSIRMKWRTRDRKKLSPGENCAWQALKLMKTRYQLQAPVQISIVKKIPPASGLGGSSSDAAAVIKGINALFGLDLSTEILQKIAAELGMDVPFFIEGGAALATHYGEQLTPLPYLLDLPFSLTPEQNPIPHKTKTLYSRLDLSKCGTHTHKTDLLVKGFRTKNPSLILQNLHNDFETLYDLLQNAHLTGSGPTQFFLGTPSAPSP